jgi:hypothetical protein
VELETTFEPGRASTNYLHYQLADPLARNARVLGEQALDLS